ncbi:hypothetical protein KCU65_g440, partial [Aureobasidium melanogenum]
MVFSERSYTAPKERRDKGDKGRPKSTYRIEKIELQAVDNEQKTKLAAIVQGKLHKERAKVDVELSASALDDLSPCGDGVERSLNGSELDSLRWTSSAAHVQPARRFERWLLYHVNEVQPVVDGDDAASEEVRNLDWVPLDTSVVPERDQALHTKVRQAAGTVPKADVADANAVESGLVHRAQPVKSGGVQLGVSYDKLTNAESNKQVLELAEVLDGKVGQRESLLSCVVENSSKLVVVCKCDVGVARILGGRGEVKDDRSSHTGLQGATMHELQQNTIDVGLDEGSVCDTNCRDTDLDADTLLACCHAADDEGDVSDAKAESWMDDRETQLFKGLRSERDTHRLVADLGEVKDSSVVCKTSRRAQRGGKVVHASERHTYVTARPPKTFIEYRKHLRSRLTSNVQGYGEVQTLAPQFKTSAVTSQLEPVLDLFVTTEFMALIASTNKLSDTCIYLRFLETQIRKAAILQLRQRLVIIGVCDKLSEDFTPLKTPELARVKFKMFELGVVGKESVEFAFPVSGNVFENQGYDGSGLQGILSLARSGQRIVCKLDHLRRFLLSSHLWLKSRTIPDIGLCQPQPWMTAPDLEIVQHKHKLLFEDAALKAHKLFVTSS